MSAAPLLAWADIETTGLEPEISRIMELGLALTTEDLEVVAQRSWVVEQRNGFAARRDLPPAVYRMHSANGLLAEVEARGLPINTVGGQALDFLAGAVEPQSSPMCGSSVHFDRSFLRQHLPRVVEHFGYRNIDVSSVKELAARWAPGVAARRPTPKRRHRVLDDIHDSIAELAFYRKELFN